MAENSGVLQGKKENKKPFKLIALDDVAFEKLVTRAIKFGQSEEWVVEQVRKAFTKKGQKGVKADPVKEKPKSTFVPNSVDAECKFGVNCRFANDGKCAFKKHNLPGQELKK